MSYRLVLRLQVKLVWFPWKTSYTLKATRIMSQNVYSQKSFHCVGAGLFSRITSLWVLEPEAVACGHVHWVLEVHSVKYFEYPMYWVCLLCCRCHQHWCGGCGGPERRCQLKNCGNCTGIVLPFVFSTCHLISGTHSMYHSMYALMYHSLC